MNTKMATGLVQTKKKKKKQFKTRKISGKKMQKKREKEMQTSE